MWFWFCLLQSVPPIIITLSALSMYTRKSQTVYVHECTWNHNNIEKHLIFPQTLVAHTRHSLKSCKPEFNQLILLALQRRYTWCCSDLLQWIIEVDLTYHVIYRPASEEVKSSIQVSDSYTNSQSFIFISYFNEKCVRLYLWFIQTFTFS